MHPSLGIRLYPESKLISDICVTIFRILILHISDSKRGTRKPKLTNKSVIEGRAWISEGGWLSYHLRGVCSDGVWGKLTGKADLGGSITSRTLSESEQKKKWCLFPDSSKRGLDSRNPSRHTKTLRDQFSSGAGPAQVPDSSVALWDFC